MRRWVAHRVFAVALWAVTAAWLWSMEEDERGKVEL